MLLGFKTFEGFPGGPMGVLGGPRKCTTRPQRASRANEQKAETAPL